MADSGMLCELCGVDIETCACPMNAARMPLAAKPEIWEVVLAEGGKTNEMRVTPWIVGFVMFCIGVMVPCVLNATPALWGGKHGMRAKMAFEEASEKATYPHPDERRLAVTALYRHIDVGLDRLIEAARFSAEAKASKDAHIYIGHIRVKLARYSNRD